MAKWLKSELNIDGKLRTDQAWSRQASGGVGAIAACMQPELWQVGIMGPSQRTACRRSTGSATVGCDPVKRTQNSFLATR